MRCVCFSTSRSIRTAGTLRSRTLPSVRAYPRNIWSRSYRCITAQVSLKPNAGSQGGYQLAKSPETLTVGEILRFTEGDLAPVACAGEETPVCTRSADCAVLPVWQGLYRVINEYLDGITLQDIMDQHRANPADDYMI